MSATGLPSAPRQDWIGRLLRGIAILVGSWAWVPRLLPQITATDKFIQAKSGGRWSLLRVACLPGVLLTVPGRKSGIARTTPLLCTPYGDGVLIAGSNFGGREKPVWVGNVRAATTMTMTFGGRQRTVSANELHDDDREAAWAEMIRLWPNYTKYAERTTRTIPVFWLRPVA